MCGTSSRVQVLRADCFAENGRERNSARGSSPACRVPSGAQFVLQPRPSRAKTEERRRMGSSSSDPLVFSSWLAGAENGASRCVGFCAVAPGLAPLGAPRVEWKCGDAEPGQSRLASSCSPSRSTGAGTAIAASESLMSPFSLACLCGPALPRPSARARVRAASKR